MQAIAVRDGREGDAPDLARLYLASRAAAMPWLRERWTEAEVAGWMAAFLLRQHRVRVAAQDGMPVGYIGFGQDPAHGPTVLHLYIEPAWRRHGIGTRLLAEAESAIGPRLRLFCFARNVAARRFYEAHGFRPIAAGDGTKNEEGEPDVLYERAADPSDDINQMGAST
ncbi:MAG TPA: GNAT family N-acetyltransferase [Acetobacteraceae bacterium]|jgi:RimJ/RimL family protein N-acetyltransferase|nr:GNAT family N-acetyltransferase [Acetobacteraceae bacterium]